MILNSYMQLNFCNHCCCTFSCNSHNLVLQGQLLPGQKHIAFTVVWGYPLIWTSNQLVAQLVESSPRLQSVMGYLTQGSSSFGKKRPVLGAVFFSHAVCVPHVWCGMMYGVGWCGGLNQPAGVLISCWENRSLVVWPPEMCLTTLARLGMITATCSI